MGGAGVELRSVTHAFPGTKGKAVVDVLDDVSLTVAPGEFVALIGPSGCGKSTLLNLVGGLLRPDEGEVVYDGAAVGGVNTDVGYMTQRDTLLPWLTVEANVALPLRFRRQSKEQQRELVAAGLERMGLGGFAHSYPGQLSGGMRSRVMIARTLVYRPRTILMDEPLGALDALLRLKMQDELLDMWRREAATVLYVTHDIEEALALADRVIVFSARPARVLCDLAVPGDRPRDTRRDQELVAMYDKVWTTLREELGP
jgi:NitT/TauT family transport system ATP-binding protein